MAVVGIFFGSDTGNTENIAKMIQKQLGKDVAEVHDIAKSSKEDIREKAIITEELPELYEDAYLKMSIPSRPAPGLASRSSQFRNRIYELLWGEILAAVS